MTEPTDADRTRAAEIAGWPAKNWTELRDAIAAALASERAAAVADLRARVEAVAEELEADSERAYQRSCGHRDEGSDGQYRAYEDAATRLRAAVTDTTGDPA